MPKITTIGDIFSHNALAAVLSQQELTMPPDVDRNETFKRLAKLLSSVRCISTDTSCLVSAYDVTVAVTGSTAPVSYIRARIRRHGDCKAFAEKYMTKSKDMPLSKENANASLVYPFEQLLALVSLYPFKAIQERVYGIVPPPKNKRPKRPWSRIPIDEVLYWRTDGSPIRKSTYEKTKKTFTAIGIRYSSNQWTIKKFSQNIKLSKADFVLAACKEKAERDGLIIHHDSAH